METKLRTYDLGVLNIATDSTEYICIKVPQTPVDVRKVLAEALIAEKLWNIEDEEDILDVLFTTGRSCPPMMTIQNRSTLAIRVATKEQKRKRRQAASKHSENTPLLIND